MKAVMLSIQPKWCELIASGKKTVEVRKTRPKLEAPFKCYIYCTKINPPWFNMLHMDRLDGKVIGEFVCERIDEYKYVEAEDPGEHFYPILTVDGEKTGLEYGDIEKYGNGKPVYFWHISDLVIYDKPKELRAFHAPFYDRCYASMSNALCDESCIFRYSCLKPKRPPQSWCYVEELEV